MRAMRAISVVRVALVWLMVWRMLSVLSRKKSWLPWRRVSRRLMPLGGVQAHLVPHPHADAAQMALPQQAAHGGGMEGSRR